MNAAEGRGEGFSPGHGLDVVEINGGKKKKVFCCFLSHIGHQASSFLSLLISKRISYTFKK